MASRKTANGRISAILDGEAWFTGLERPSLRMELQETFVTQFFSLECQTSKSLTSAAYDNGCLHPQRPDQEGLHGKIRYWPSDQTR